MQSAMYYKLHTIDLLLIMRSKYSKNHVLCCSGALRCFMYGKVPLIV